MRIIIKDRDEYLHYVEYHYCENCAHKNECNWFYLCPPLDEEWKHEEEIRRELEE